MHLRMSLVLFFTSLFYLNGVCQNYITKTGFIGFYSKTFLEDIKAENNQVYAVIDPVSHRIAFALLVKGFIFTKELMEEHFNENYIESDKFPKATFSGNCSGQDMDLDKEGIYQVVIKGDLTLHGVTRTLETTAQLDVKNGYIQGLSVFKINPEDFNIHIPGLVREKIAEEINVKVKINCIRSKY